LTATPLRPSGSSFLSCAAGAFAGAVVFRMLYFNDVENSQQTGNSLVVAGFYALVSISAILLVMGILDSAIGRMGSPDSASRGPPPSRYLAYCAVAGLSLTTISFFYLNGTVFLNGQATGFPLAYAFRSWFFGQWYPLQLQPLPALLDFGFWLAMAYLFLAGVPVRWRLVRGPSEALVGFGGTFLFSAMVAGLLYQRLGVSDQFLAPFLLILCVAIGYVQIRRGFKVMGPAIAFTGIFLAAVLTFG